TRFSRDWSSDVCSSDLGPTHGPVDHQREAGQDDDEREEQPPTRPYARVAGPHRRGELRVLGERLRHLLPRTLLMFRERHGSPPGPADRGSRLAAWPQVYEGAGRSESRTSGATRRSCW